MKGKNLLKMLGFLTCGGMLLQTTGCADTIVPTLINTAIPLIVEILLSSITT